MDYELFIKECKEINRELAVEILLSLFGAGGILYIEWRDVKEKQSNSS